jgi:hypothetical protein
VEELGAFIGPAGRRIDRVGVVLRLLLEVALQQSYRLSATDVDGGIEDHAGVGDSTQMPAKLESSRNPAALDFSG